MEPDSDWARRPVSRTGGPRRWAGAGLHPRPPARGLSESRPSPRSPPAPPYPSRQSPRPEPPAKATTAGEGRTRPAGASVRMRCADGDGTRPVWAKVDFGPGGAWAGRWRASARASRAFSAGSSRAFSASSPVFSASGSRGEAAREAADPVAGSGACRRILPRRIRPDLAGCAGSDGRRARRRLSLPIPWARCGGSSRRQFGAAYSQAPAGPLPARNARGRARQ